MADADVVVVGAGPNGLSAAVAMAREGFGVTVHEAAERIGGGTRTEALTLPGFLHDVCSAIHPMGAASPFFRTLPLAAHGLEWVHPPVLLAHPFDDGTAALLYRDMKETGAGLGVDGAAWRKLFAPFVQHWKPLFQEALAPPLHVPRRPLLLGRMGLAGLPSALALARRTFESDRTRSLFAGIAGHTLLPLDRSPSAAFGLMLVAAGHAVGWPLARGGSQTIADALAGVLEADGGRIVTGSRVRSLEELPDARATFLSLTPRQVLEVAGPRLPVRYRRALSRYRYAPGVFKVDWALSDPIPWEAEDCGRAGTVHLAGTTAEVARSADDAWHGRHDEKPYLILAQPSLFDGTRAPEGRHTAWAYCHVPRGSTVDRTEVMERQVERFAPGFRDTILARHTMNTAELEAHNPNMVGGDINGGVQDIEQFLFRPVRSLDPHRAPVKGLYLCSASTPPGGAVHGMCGYHAAQSALKRLVS